MLGFYKYLGVVCLSCFGILAHAQQNDLDTGAPPPFVDFSPKFGKPPPDGQLGKIDVEIAPVVNSPFAQKSLTENLSKNLPDKMATPKGSYPWFWNVIPAVDRQGRAASDFRPALDHLRSAPQAQDIFPRLNDIQTLLALYKTDILSASVQFGVSPPLIASVIYVESGGDPRAVSRSGAQGLMQLIPATADRFKVQDAFNPRQNIMAGTEYLAWLLNEFEGDVLNALGGYNAGENTIKRAGGIPNIEETRGYVPKVLAAYLIAQSFCKTPPVLVTDGCVFSID